MTMTAIPRGYRRLREAGFNAKEALRGYKVREAFLQAEDEGLVRFTVEPDDITPQEAIDDCEWRNDHERRQAYLSALKQGVCGIIGSFKCPTCGHWEVADSVWGFIGEDWRDSGYDIDVMEATLDALRSGHAFVGHHLG